MGEPLIVKKALRQAYIQSGELEKAADFGRLPDPSGRGDPLYTRVVTELIEQPIRRVGDKNFAEPFRVADKYLDSGWSLALVFGHVIQYSNGRKVELIESLVEHLNTTKGGEGLVDEVNKIISHCKLIGLKEEAAYFSNAYQSVLNSGGGGA